MIRLVIAMVSLWCGAALAGDVVIELPSDVATASVITAPGTTAPAVGAKVSIDGKTIKVVAEPKTRVTLEANLRNGTKLIGVDLSWHRPVKPAEEKLSEQDIAAIREILTVTSFYDRVEILRLSGDADRATALMQLVRDRDFHAGSGEVIWRAEIWYFEFADGGWLKVSQKNKVLDRQRFVSAEKYREYTEKLRYVPELGGIEVSDTPVTIAVTDEQLIKVGPAAAQ